MSWLKMRFLFLIRYKMTEALIKPRVTLLLSRKSLRIFILLILILWCTGFSINLFFPDNGILVLYPLLKQVYAGVCHQVGYKSFEVNNLHLLVCARCSGIYFGALLSILGLIFIPVRINHPIKYLFLSALPMFIDIIFYSSGIYIYSKWIAFVTGILFGSVAIVYILVSIENILFKESKEKNEV